MDRPSARGPVTARFRVMVAFAAGTSAGVLTALLGASVLAPLVGWDVAAITFIVWSWLSEWKLDAAATATHAIRETQVAPPPTCFYWWRAWQVLAPSPP